MATSHLMLIFVDKSAGFIYVSLQDPLRYKKNTVANALIF